MFDMHAAYVILFACASLCVHHNNTQLNDSSKKLNVISAHFDTPNVAWPSQPHAYAFILAVGIKPPVKPKVSPRLQFDLTPVQANNPCPFFADLSKDDLSEKIDKALMDTGCFFETKPCVPGLDGSDGVEHITPHIHAIGWHCSGDIWLGAYSKAECSFHIRMAHHWVPQLSDQLSITQKTYLVLAHFGCQQILTCYVAVMMSATSLPRMITWFSIQQCSNMPSSSLRPMLFPNTKPMAP